MKLLVTGGGSIGERHIRNIKRINGVTVSLCEPRQERAQELRKRYDLDEIVPGYEQTDLSDFDAVLIATPVNSHIDFATKAVNAGCHVLIEKPLSHSLEGVDELDSLAKEKGLVVGVAFVRKFHPLISNAKEIIASGKLGKLCTAYCIEGQHLPLYRPDYKQTYFVHKEMGGGITLDWAPHNVNLICHLLGEVEKVLCIEKLYALESECEDATIMILIMKNGAVVQFSSNAFQKNSESINSIVGTKGTVQYSFESCELSHFNGATQSWSSFQHHVNYGEDLFEAQARNFINAIADKEEIRTGIPEAKYTMQVIFAAIESAKKSQFIKI